MRQLDSFLEDYMEMTAFERIQLYLWFKWTIWRRKRHTILLRNFLVAFWGLILALSAR